MDQLNANDAQRYADFKEWTPYEAALLFAGCKPLPRGQIPEVKGNTPAFNLIQAVLHCGPFKSREDSQPPEVWLRWYSEHLAGRDIPVFSQQVILAMGRSLVILESEVVEGLAMTVLDGVTPELVEPIKGVGAISATAPRDRGWVLKRSALIKKHRCQWPTIERDFQDASTNQLSKEAKAPERGNWFEDAALKWAEQRGKLTKVVTNAAPATPFSGLTHKNKC